MSLAPKTDSVRRNFPAVLDRYFHISERGSTHGREFRGGLVTFFTMAYIVVLNPLIIGGFGPEAAALDVEGGWLDAAQVGAVTALTAGVMTIVFGLVANLPFGFAAGLGINSFLAVSVVGQVTWAEAMGLVLINGVIIVILASTGLRELVFNAVPRQLKLAITVGIGLFIAFIGLVNSGFVTGTVSGPPVQLGVEGSVATLPTLTFLVGLVLMGVLVARKVRGALLLGIVGTTVLAIALEAALKLGPSFENEGGWSLNVPQIPAQIFALPDLGLLGEFSFGAFERIGALGATMLVFTLVFTNFFDAMGSLTGLSATAGLADKDGGVPKLKRALIVEGMGAIAGGAASASSNTIFVDSASGIGEGARTGLANVYTGVFFLLAMFLTPLTEAVPLEVAAAALVVVGCMMMTQIKEIDFAEFSVALPAFLTIAVMPFTYSIANGIGIGFIAWVLVQSLSGKIRQVSPLLWVVALGFVIFFARGPIELLFGG